MMSRLNKIGCFRIVAIPLLLLTAFTSCKKELPKAAPTVKTLLAANVSATSVKVNGEVINDGGSSVTARGICWSINPNPTTAFADSLTNDGAGPGTFAGVATKLQPGLSYYFKAYATNAVGTAYGFQVSLTLAAVQATLTTSAITIVSQSTVTCGGNITSDGGAAVYARGVCWGTKQNPTISNSFTTDGSGSGAFVSSLTKLNPDSTYYVRAYATNLLGTAYGNSRTITIGSLVVSDRDGNYYHTIKIGSQVWLKENLKTTTYRDSTIIPLVESSSSWSGLIMPGYCWYNNDAVAYKDVYGALYNWQTVATGKLCPTGWHVPSDAEWTTLIDFLGGESAAGGKLKELGVDHWTVPNAVATNSSLFTALPGGYRTNSGLFVNVGNYGNWWSSTPSTTLPNVANYRYLYYGNGTAVKSFVSQKYGLSVRCIKN